jgi:hypothetical protein
MGNVKPFIDVKTGIGLVRPSDLIPANKKRKRGTLHNVLGKA